MLSRRTSAVINFTALEQWTYVRFDAIPRGVYGRQTDELFHGRNVRAQNTDGTISSGSSQKWGRVKKNQV